MGGFRDRCSGTPAGAPALLLVLRHSCWCYGTPVAWAGTSCWYFGTPVGASAHLLVLRNFCCVGSHVLIGAPALLLVLRHFCCVGRHVLLVLRHSYWCFGTPIGATALLFCIVPSGTYYTASYLLLMIGLGSQIDI